MTPQQFLESKGVQDLSEPFSASTIGMWLEDYVRLEATKIIKNLSATENEYQNNIKYNFPEYKIR